MKRMITAVLALAALCSCQQPRLVILHTNDTHSHFEAIRGGEDDGRGGVIERAAFVDSVRNAMGEGRVLLLHAGDFNQGSSYFSELGGSLEVETVNAFRYDCITLGNHELDNGIEDLCERVKRINCPVVCANIDWSPFELGKYIQPYAVIERGGMKIGIIGLETDLSVNVSKTTSSRLRQLDDTEVVNKWSAYLRNEEKCDLVILLSHIGFVEDQELVPTLHGVDFVIGGHSHTKIDKPAVVRDADRKKVPVVQDGGWGLEMGMLTVY